MPDTNYQVNPKSLKVLLREAGDGRVRLPEFQRDWVWDDDRIRSLLASISLSYPVGAVMMLELETGKKGKFEQRLLEGAKEPATEAADRLILDGQQRLTSLFQSLLLDAPVATEDHRGGKIKRWYYIDMQKAVHGEEADREDAILSIPEDRRLRSSKNVIEADYSTDVLEYRNMVFPLKDMLDPRDWEDGFKKYWSEQGDEEKRTLWNTFDRLVGENFNHYQIPVISLGKNTPPAAVCQVFEKVNTGGMPLTVFELLTATFAIDGFKLRDDWKDREETLKKRSELTEVSDTNFLQAVTLLATRERQEQARKKGTPRPPAISCKRADMLRLTLKEYKKWADRLMGGFERAAFFLRTQNVRDAKFLAYGSQLIPLAAILTVLNKNELTAGKEKLAQWYWCGVFGELYGGTIETRFARDLPDVVDWVRSGESTPRTVEEARERFHPNRLLSLKDFRSAAFKGVYSLILREKARDWSTGYELEHFNDFDYAVDIHHIFPKKWCSEEKIDMDLCDSVVNKTPLYAPTNRRLGADAPSKYISAIGSDKAKLDEYLRSHFIEPELLRGDNFEEFFKARHEKLVDQIGEAMGHKVNMDMAADYEVNE